MEQTIQEVITLTPNAVKAAKRMRDKKQIDNLALRVGVEGGGCSGLSYKLGFDTETAPGDVTCEFDGLRVIVDAKSALYLQGMTLDFSDALVGGGFKFANPNAKKHCGCGESFSA